MAYHINETLGDIEYEVVNGNELVLKVRGGVGGGGTSIYIIKEDDATEPSDTNVFSAARTLAEIQEVISSQKSDYFELLEDTKGTEYIKTKYPIVTERGLTAYSGNELEISSIYDGLLLDPLTLKWNENGQLTVIGGTGSGGTVEGITLEQMWSALANPTSEQIHINHLTNALSKYATLEQLNTKWTQDDVKISNWDTAYGWGNHAEAGYAHLAKEETFTDVKHFSQGLSIGVGKHRLYEQDGVVYFDGDLAVTGGITAYALGSKDVSTIMDGVVVDGTTIAKVDGVLKVLNAGGGEAGSVAWENVTSKPTTLGGYGITDAYTKTESDNRFASKEHNHPYLPYQDTRNENYSPYDNNFNERGLSATHLKTNTVDGLNDGGMYHASVYLYPWGDPSGGAAHNLAFTDNGNMWLRSGTSSWNSWKKLAFTTDNVASATNADKVDNYHAGNSSGQVAVSNGTVCTNLNADLLDGFQITSLRRCYITNSHNVYDCLGTIQLPQNGYAARLYLVVGNGYNASESQSRVGMIILRTSNDTPNGSGKYYAGHVEAFRYGLYDIYVVQNSSTSFTLWTDRTNYTGSGYISVEATPGVNFTSSSATSTTLPTGAVLLPKYQVAYTDSNVASATKLQTARTIWGQSFDGTANVNGNISNVGNIDARTSNGGYTIYAGISSGESFRLDSYNGSGTWTANAICALTNGNVGIGTISATYKLDVKGDIHANGWLRTTGNVGWYSQSYGGGWYMTDSTWIRTFNNKSVYSGKGVFLTGAGSQYAYSVANLAEVSNCRFRIDKLSGMSANNARPIFGWQDSVSDGWTNSYIMGTYRPALSTWGRIYWGVFQYETSKSQKAYMELRGDTNMLYVAGNILASGGITCYSSDQRAKTVIEQISLSLKQIANAPTIRFKWNDWKIKDDGKTHIGGIAQYMQKLLPETVLEADDMLNMDYSTTAYIFSVQTARHLQTYETRTDKELRKLKKRVLYLEKQLKQLGYEETDFVAD